MRWTCAEREPEVGMKPSASSLPMPAATMRHPDNVLEVEQLSVRFGMRQMIRDLAFTVAQGTSLAIIGSNGVGKSVLLRALLGSIPSEGVIRWAPGTRVGYVPQKLDLERDLPMTGNDLLRARLTLAGHSGFTIVQTFDLVGLSKQTGDQLIGTYSGGQFQRLLVAFALLGEPNVLILDEPTAGVDEPGQEQLNVLINRVQRDHNLTVLFISHDLSVVSRGADCVLCLGRHQQVFLGAPRDILNPEILQEAYGMPVKYHIHEH